ICCRPLFILSASAMSSGDCRSTASLATVCRVSLIGGGLRSGEGRGDGLLIALRRANLAGPEREGGPALFQLGGIARRPHAFLQQPQGLDAPFELAALQMQRTQFGIGGQIVVADGAERQDGGNLAVLARGRRVLAAGLVAAVVEQGVFGGEQAFLLVGL